MRQFYLTFLTIGVLFVGFSLSKIDEENYSIDSYKKKNLTVPKPIPLKKRGPLVLKYIAPENSIMNMLVPSMTVVKSVSVEGGGNAVLGGQLNYSVLVTNNGTDATGVTFTDVLSGDLTLVAGSLKASPIAVDESYDCIGNVGINVPTVSGVLANDINPVNTNMTTTAVNTAGTQGTVTLNPDGSFTFVPNAGFSGATTFGYTMSNTHFARTATVTINVSAPIWFVNIAAASNGTGTLASPFKDWSDFATSNALSGVANPAANQTVFVYAGTYTGAATLKAGQKILGQGATTSLASFAGVTVPSFSNPALPATGGTSPNLTSSGNTITLNSGNTLRGFGMGVSTKDIIGSSFGTLTVSEVTLDGNGQALDLNTGTLAATFLSISSTNSADEGVELNTVAGTLTSTGGTTITNPTSQGIEIYGNAALTANFGNTNIAGSGNVGFINTSSSASSSTMTFADFDISPDASQQAIQTTFKGSLTCTSGTILSSGAIGGAIGNISSANLENLSMVLDSYTASGSTNGLLIQNTTGSFTVNGIGTTAGSGGTISNISAKGININNASNITLKNMNFTNANTADGTLTGSSNTAANAAINAISVAGLTLNNVVVSGTTTQVGLNLSTCSNVTVTNSSFTNCGTSGVIEEAGIVAMNLSGTCAISGTTVSTSGGRNVFIRNTGSTLLTALNVTSSTFSTANGASNFLFESIDNANSTMVFKSNTFSNPTTRGLDILAGGAATINVQVGGPSLSDGNTITAKTVSPGSDGLYIQSASNTGSPTVNYNVINNTIQTSFNGYFPINIGGQGTGGQFTGRINNNTTSIANAIVATSGMGIYVAAYGRVKHVTEIKNNTVNNAGNYGIQAETNDNNTNGADGTMDATIQNNNVNMIAGGSAYAHYGLTSNNVGASSGNMVTCANTSGNVSNGVPVAANFEVSSYVLAIPATRATVKIQGNYGALPGAWTTPNPAGGLTAIDAGGGGTVTLSGVFTCLTPTNTAAARLMAQADDVNSDKSTEALAEIKQNTQNENSSELIVSKIKEDNTSVEEVGVTDNVDAYSDFESQNSIASSQSGETVTVNGTGSGFNIPAGKNMTVTFSATISNTPSTCAITNQASVSGSNFATVNSNTTTTNVVIPVPTAVTPSSATNICIGNSLNLAATCASGSVNWYTVAAPSTLLGNSASGANFSRSPTVNTTYIAKCLVGGCESTGTNTGLITVNPLPTITVSASPAICVGAVSFTIPYTATTGTPTTYSISGTGITTVTDAALPATPITVNLSSAASGSSYSYTLTVKNANDCVSGNVTGSVTVNPIPTITTGASTAICIGATSFAIPYTATTGTPTSYSISGTGITTVTNGALTSSPIVVNLSTGASGSSISYTLTVSNAGGCTSSNVTGSVTVNPLPTLTQSASPSICAGATSFTIPYTATSGTPITYSISGTGITTVTDGALSATPITVNLSSGASGSSISYILTVKNANGCTSSNINGSVTVNALPTLTKSASPAICAGATSFTIPYTATTGTPTTYSISGTGITSVTDATLPASPITVNISDVGGATGSSYAYTLTVKNASGCSSTNITGNVTVNSTPAPTSPTATPSSRTTIGSSTLSATGCVGGTITWYNATDNVAVPSPNNQPNFTAQGTYNFYAKCTGANTCVSDASANVSVSVNLCTPLASSPGNVNITWTGLLSNDWSTACNWSPAWVPDLTSGKVIIPNTINKPVISASIPDVKSIEIQAAALLTINSGRTLNVRGDGGLNKGFTIAGGTVVNNGTINIESETNTAIPAYIYLQATDAVLTNNGTIKINSSDEAIGVGSVSTPATITNSLNGIINIVGGIGVEIALPSDVVNFNNAGTINYDGTVLAFKFLGTTNFTNTGTVNINSGTGIENPTGNTITNNACGKILMASGIYTNGGITTNAGLIQMPSTYSFANTGTFTNSGVLKANAVSGITNNKMVITNACPIFTLGGTNNYTVSGIFTDAGATTSAGTYTAVGNKFTANNTIPTGTQTLYAQVTDGTCTFVVPFTFDNVKPSAVSVSTTSVCVGTNVTLSATCASGTVTWYSSASGTSSLGTGSSFVYTPGLGTGQSFYAACETTNCASGRTATSNSLSVYSVPSPPTITPPANLIVCSPSTLTLNASGCESGTITWSQGAATGTSLVLSTVGTYSITATCTISGCTSNASTAVTGLEIKAPLLPNPNSDSPKCVGETLTFSSLAEMTNYAWVGPNSFTSGSQNPSISNATLAASGTYTVTVTNANGCTASASVTATVNALATASATPTTQTVCSGGAITMIAITGTGTSYSWTRDNTTGVTGIASSGSGDISGTLTNTTNSPITVTFSITPNGTCNGTPITATVVVNPIPSATASTPSQSVCSGVNITGITFNTPIVLASAIETIEAVSSSDLAAPKATLKETQGITFISAVAGTVFNWTRDNVGTVGGNIPASGSGNISGNFTNTTSSPITVTFTVTPAYTNAGTTCTGTPITVTVTVNPNPVAIITDTGTSLCGGSSTTLSAPADPNFTYAWQRSITGIASPNSFTAFGGTGQTQVVTTSGAYRLILTNQFNCSTTDTTAVKIGDFLFNGSLGAGDAQQTGRMNRFAVASTCAAPTTYQGNFTTTGSRYYDSYTITNTRNVPVCATIALTSNCGTSIFSAAYLGSFNPASLGTNYLADHGSSFPGTSFYEATIPANGTIVVVVHEVNPGTGCAAYSLKVDVPREAAGITVTPNGPVCAGTPLTITASAANTYAWSPGGATTRTINASPTTTATYSVTLGYGNGTCSATATTQVVVDPVVAISSNSPVCEGNTLNLSSGTASSYSWTGPNSFTSSVQNPSITNVTPAAGGTYTLVAVNGGCTTTATTAVIINSLPVPNPSSDTPKCVGTTLTFNSAAGMTSYAWTGPNSFSASTQNPSISSVTTAASGTYTLTATNASGCSASATTVVTINQALPPSISPPPSLSVCSPSTLTLTANGCTGGIITWSEGAATGTSLVLSVVGTYSITATCTVNGCTSEASTAVTGLEIKAKPSAPTITPPPNLVVCSPSTLTLSASGCVGGTITWSEGAATGTSLELTAIGTYSISAICTINGCSSDASVAVTGLEIKVKPQITTQPQNLSICQGNNATFTVQANLPGVTYQWEVNTGSGFAPVVASTVYSGENTASLSLAFPPVGYNGYQYRCVVSINGCTATSVTSTLSMAGSAEALNIVNITPISGVYSQTAVAYTIAMNKIEPNANVTFKSGNAIQLLPGFETRAGAVFTAKIESPCGNNSTFNTNFDNLPKEIRK
ncbi:hypothetical protein EGI26_06295 [Lacihabitans sp. CCS-44]|uniref:beta strand repeat-containing protein n=1 Tax=Lacihabitans sp. CCS-44 TaxID=2487331 RepID=UPI0020CEC492|nr:3-coathanger stack domain-containing protein [Lacihabitans sp. CCS-44]MCP9754772.1 hypothetical protein [Lacihabitans sp. CCS-44]